MLTLHRATVLLASPTAPPVSDGAVLVRGDRVAALGRYEELAAAHPEARVRAWEGTLTPGRAHPYGGLLLERCYHPDPREELGEDPLAPPRELTDADWGASARRGLQRLLAHGTTALAGPFERAAVRTAVSRSGLLVVPPITGVTGIGAASTGSDRFVAELMIGPAAFAMSVPHGALTPGGRADFAVFEGAPEPAEDPSHQACAATVLAGRLLHRRR
ncbi:cytosine/adenosine deaminase-related metal-dependent hydrolase [Kitasatospora sp. MAA4]|uniref:imidazolonepropionase-like domain-containing protein n=1 Tax=Kitasatospora sp. MAA4 TaxID=3035093 RepID=UPI002473EFED|nr:hypothetical protein [Kitasatospora sp. MAA4]MDH6134001.1 cytosine/adenosine deaminase-related metal-dependent hydrolase [Kitasatospora sp. MAA4]